MNIIRDLGDIHLNQEKERNNFTGTLGFVLASAASAIGLGNIWRFPFLAARDGGGLFLVCYLLLVATFGYTLLSSEIAIGRKTRQGPLTAYTLMDKRIRCCLRKLQSGVRPGRVR